MNQPPPLLTPELLRELAEQTRPQPEDAFTNQRNLIVYHLNAAARLTAELNEAATASGKPFTLHTERKRTK